jgi:acyl-CoA thioesterase YciA
MNNDKRVTMRLIPQPSDINVNGNIFGGWVLSQMDLAGADIAKRRSGGPVATVAINGMTFHCPIEVGDVISVYAEVVKVGRTSITVNIEVFAERGLEGTRHHVTEGTYVFVAVDENGRPRPVDQ